MYRIFDNTQNLVNSIARSRLVALDENAQCETYDVLTLDGRKVNYIKVDSILTDIQIVNALAPAMTTAEINELANAKTDKQQIKAEYQTTLDQLINIENAVNPTNAQVIAAVKFLAKTLRLLLKLLARMI